MIGPPSLLPRRELLDALSRDIDDEHIVPGIDRNGVCHPELTIIITVPAQPLKHPPIKCQYGEAATKSRTSAGGATDG
jgi:hypothetical protein